MRQQALIEIKEFAYKYNLPPERILGYIETQQIHDQDNSDAQLLILQNIAENPEEMTKELKKHAKRWIQYV